MFYIKFKDLQERSRFLVDMKTNEIGCVFHYVPLHSSEAGEKYSRLSGMDKWTTKESERLVRLPMYYQLGKDKEIVVEKIIEYIKNKI